MSKAKIYYHDFGDYLKIKMANLHTHQENLPPYETVKVIGAEPLSFLITKTADTTLYRVEKMRFPKKGQKDNILYNSRITITNIPEEAYEYVVNGKSAIEWMIHHVPPQKRRNMCHLHRF